jgi:hypothetical protein
MGFRFFRRKKLFPGVTLNISKSGLSVSLGVRGAKLTLGSKGIRKTVGLPGTGLYYTEQTSYKKMADSTSDDGATTSNSGYGPLLFLLISLVVIFALIVHFR